MRFAVHVFHRAARACLSVYIRDITTCHYNISNINFPLTHFRF